MSARTAARAVPNGAAENSVTLEPGSLLAKTMGAERVICSCHHHQALDRLGDGVRVTARADDGVVEGVEVDGAWVARRAVAPRRHRRRRPRTTTPLRHPGHPVPHPPLNRASVITAPSRAAFF